LAGAGGQIKPGYLAYQVESTSRIRTDLGELRRELSRLRRIAAAERTGGRLGCGETPQPFRVLDDSGHGPGGSRSVTANETAEIVRFGSSRPESGAIIRLG
jgi:hypothetical protein